MSPRWPCALLLFATFGCGEDRAPLGTLRCEAWVSSISPLLQDQCVACHGPARAEAEVRLDGYAETLEVASQPSFLSVFVDSSTHAGLAGARPTLERWVSACALAYREPGLHPAGILNPESADFHATALRASGYDFETCQGCHGEDYSGGAADSTCLSCHPGGPTACVTCHGSQMTSGAHAAHPGGGVLSALDACERCHEVPSDALDPGHFRLSRGVLDEPPAEVVFDTVAAWGPPSSSAPTPSGMPTYASGTQTCSGVYCHGGGWTDTAATHPEPRWLDRFEGCASCHGAPPATPHAQAEGCADCHVEVIAKDGSFLDTTLHLNGRLELGPSSCDGCHGGTDGGPPPDLDGRSSPSLPTVGAHLAHAQPKLRLGNPVECGECHLVPATVTDPGHIDSDRPAEVFPLGAGPLSASDGASPSYDRPTCAGNYCHGGGASLGADQSPAKLDTLNWTRDAVGQVFCGSCHGIPPQTSSHPSPVESQTCASCHATSVDAFGNILFEEGRTLHMDGTVDLAGDGT